jgi:tight adherence protein C
MDPVLIGIIAVVAFVLFVAGYLIWVGIRDANEPDPLEERLAEFAQLGETATLEEIEMSQSFRDRILIPMAKGFGNVALRFTPQQAIQETGIKLERAGNPSGLDPTVFYAIKFVGIGLGGLFLVLSTIVPDGSFFTGTTAFLLSLGAAVIGYQLPELWLQSKINRRQKEILRALPDALDLLMICVEAGLGFNAAMARVQSKWEGELSLIFQRVLREMQLGKPRREALRDMADRVGLSELTSFVAAVIQSEQLGVSMANVLRVQSEAMRVKRRQLAEEEAQKAPIKMLFPMAFLIFPSLLIILLGPAALILMTSTLGNTLF